MVQFKVAREPPSSSLLLSKRERERESFVCDPGKKSEKVSFLRAKEVQHGVDHNTKKEKQNNTIHATNHSTFWREF
jgi:hypothetical protein